LVFLNEAIAEENCDENDSNYFRCSVAVTFAGAPALAQMNNDSMSDPKMKMSHSDEETE
jgi:hypothetical protein